MTALDRLINHQPLSLTDARDIIENQADWSEKIKDHASAVRRQVYGNKVYIRGLIELSSYCRQDCYYCGLRRGNQTAHRYRLDEASILAQAGYGYQLGVRTFVLQGGEDAYFTDERLVSLIKQLKDQFPEAAITLSLGERSDASYQALKAAGVDRYLLRHETADSDHYQVLHPSPMTFGSRRDCLYRLKELGFQTGAGMMIGSPGQTNETLAKDLLFLQDLKPQMVGIGPFIHSAGTKFEQEPDGDVERTLYLLNVVRLLLPAALIPATTALATMDETARIRALTTSANVLMPNLTPAAVRENYAIYADKRSFALEAIEGLTDLDELLKQHNLAIDLGRGDYKGSNDV